MATSWPHRPRITISRPRLIKTILRLVACLAALGVATRTPQSGAPLSARIQQGTHTALLHAARPQE